MTWAAVSAGIAALGLATGVYSSKKTADASEDAASDQEKKAKMLDKKGAQEAGMLALQGRQGSNVGSFLTTGSSSYKPGSVTQLGR